jgi:hypothetical protein
MAGIEVGCSATINNAPPAAVVALAALTSQVTVDALLRQGVFGPETIDVYRPLDEAPFDRIGRIMPTWDDASASRLAV